jgi:hypothetical protein
MIDQITDADFADDILRDRVANGSKTRATVRTKNLVDGENAEFDVVPSGVVIVPLRETPCLELVDVFVEDDEKSLEAVVKAAISRSFDETILAAMAPCSNRIPLSDAEITEGKINRAIETLDLAGIPDDGERHGCVGWQQWSAMLDIQGFADAEWLSTEELGWPMTQGKRWKNVIWRPYSSLVADGGIRLCHIHHRSAVGHAVGKRLEIKIDVKGMGNRRKTLISAKLTQGAAILEPKGVVGIPCLER